MSDPTTATATIDARLDQLPSWPFRRPLIPLLGAVFFFANWNLGDLGPVLPRVMTKFQVDLAVGTAVVSLSSWGYVVGALAIGAVSYRFGRRAALISTAALFGIGSSLDAFGNGIVAFGVGRALIGLGIGAAGIAISTYLTELAPQARRGRCMAYVTLIAVLATAFVPWISLALVPWGSWGWRLFVGLPALSIVIMLIGLPYIPESPRWLASRGRYDQANHIVVAAERRVGHTRPADGEHTASPQPSRPGAQAQGELANPSWTTLFRGGQLGVWALLFAVWFLNFFAVFTVLGLAPSLMVQHGYTLTETLQIELGLSIGGIVGGVVSPFVADRWSKERTAAIACVSPGLVLILFGVYPNPVVVVIGLVLVAVQAGIFLPLMTVLTTARFPVRMRNSGLVSTIGLGQVGGVLGPILGLAAAQALGFSGFWIVMGATFVLMAVGLLALRARAPGEPAGGQVRIKAKAPSTDLATGHIMRH
jgi:putative MFS transporter